MATVVLLQLACFTGDDARGLPCMVDADCGVGQACVDSFCDGPPESSCGDGTLDFDEACDDGDANGDNARCKADCTLNVCGDGVVGPDEGCDNGSDNADDAACKSDCTPATCGDGIQGPGEACDDGADNGSGQACKANCSVAECGDLRMDPGEDCDDGGESATCDDDCTAATCGDGTPNSAAGEACDDGNGDDDDDCLSNCARVDFRDDMNGGEGAWTHETVDGAIADGWSLQQTRSDSAPAAWHSGTPPDAPGSTRLVSPEIDLRDASGAVRLAFTHWWDFDDCGDPNFSPDGARVEVSADGGPFVAIDPVVPYPDVLDEDAICGGDQNPLATMPAWGHDSGDRFEPATFELDAFAGQTVRIGFRAAFDCNACDPKDGWYLDDVLVSSF